MLQSFFCSSPFLSLPQVLEYFNFCAFLFLHLMLPPLQICKAFPWPQAKEIAKIFYLASEVTGKNCVQQRCLHKQGHRTVVPDKLILA